MTKETIKAKTPAKPKKKGKAGVSVKKEPLKAAVGGSKGKGHSEIRGKGKKPATSKPRKNEGIKQKQDKPAKKVFCQLPGADLLNEGKSVKEVMESLEKEKENSLDLQEERFCQEYVSCNVAVRAALRVWPDLSYDYANVKAGRMMQNDSIKARIEQITEEHKERYGLTDDKVLKRLAAIAMFDRRTLHKPDGTIKQIHELTEEEAAAITEIESVELFDGRGGDRHAIGIVRKVKFADPKGAIELAGRNLKLWKDPGSKDNPIQVVNRIELVPLD